MTEPHAGAGVPGCSEQKKNPLGEWVYGLLAVELNLSQYKSGEDRNTLN